MSRNDFNAFEWTLPSVAVIGMGMSRADLGATALDWLASAEVLVGGARHLDLFPEHPAERIILRSPLSRQLAIIAEISQTRRTAVLASGDPLFYGIGRRLMEVLGKDRLIVLPNVTGVQVLCARLREPWEAVETISLHGRNDSEAATRLVETLERDRVVAVYTDHLRTPQWIAEQIRASSRLDVSMVVGEELGTGSERIREFSLSEILEAGPFSPLNIVLIRSRKAESKMDSGSEVRQVFGFSENEYEREAGLITKMEVRAVALALLSLEPGKVMWDVGAATGSVSIEAARLSPSMRVFAVEKSPSRFSMLVNNIQRLGGYGIQAVSGGAPQALGGLPDPDRVFIGGSGNDLGEVLRVVADRLRPGGVVVQAIVLLDTLEKVKRFWEEEGVEVSITQLQVSRSVTTGKSLRLEALNPVFLVSFRR
ncbi:MAG: precorrin-6y C5,15-methyltransferase (decarboxylating) subunit CbiE [Syntrophobacteraceae bacterium]